MSGISYCTPSNLTCNYDVGSPNFFRGEVSYSSYGYNVNWSSAGVFLGMFAASAVLHLVQGTFSKHRWTLFTFGAGAICEAVGWGGRLFSRISTKWLPDAGGYYWSDFNGFIMQICCLIIAPAFLAAGLYILHGRLMNILGREYSWIHPTSYAIVAIVGDVISLVVQAVGGALASVADDRQGQDDGAYIMVGGVFWQVVIMCFYSSILLSYIVRYKQRKPFAHQVQLFTWWPNALRPKSQKKGLHATTDQGIPMKGVQESKLHDRSDSVDTATNPSSGTNNTLVWTPKEQKKAETMLWVCVGATTLIFIRSIYRSIELLDGWSGPIIENQGLFDGLDGALMLIVCIAFNVFHPRWWVASVQERRKASLNKGEPVV